MSALVRLPAVKLRRVALPDDARPGDRFLSIEFDNDALCGEGLYKGLCLLVRAGPVEDGELASFQYCGRQIVARLYQLRRGYYRFTDEDGCTVNAREADVLIFGPVPGRMPTWEDIEQVA